MNIIRRRFTFPVPDRSTLGTTRPGSRRLKNRTQTLLIAGTLTSVCMAFPTLSALAAGYKVFAIIDASGNCRNSGFECLFLCRRYRDVLCPRSQGKNRLIRYGRIRKKEVVRNIQGKYNTPRITYRTGGRSPRTGCSRIHCRDVIPRNTPFS